MKIASGFRRPASPLRLEVRPQPDVMRNEKSPLASAASVFPCFKSSFVLLGIIGVVHAAGFDP